MNYTANYQLNQWESADKVRREDFNEDNKKLDSAIAGLAGALGGKADLAALAEKGNCRMAAGSYTGKGGYGASSKVTLNFPFSPAVVFVAGGSYQGVTTMLRPHPYAAGEDTAGRGSVLKLTWGTTSLSWYADRFANGDTVSSSVSEDDQLNEQGKTYTYLILGQA